MASTDVEQAAARQVVGALNASKDSVTFDVPSS